MCVYPARVSGPGRLWTVNDDSSSAFEERGRLPLEALAEWREKTKASEMDVPA